MYLPRLKREKWLVKAVECGLYAGKHGGWTQHDYAKRFKKRSDAQYVADILSITALVDCITEKE